MAVTTAGTNAKNLNLYFKKALILRCFLHYLNNNNK